MGKFKHKASFVCSIKGQENLKIKKMSLKLLREVYLNLHHSKLFCYAKKDILFRDKLKNN